MTKTSSSPFIAQARIDTPLGPLTAVATERGLAGLWFDGQAHHPGALDVPHDEHQRWISEARDELTRYFSDEQACDHRFEVPLDPQGTPFQQAVWRVLMAIEPGSVLTYREVAERAGSPQAVRAVGAAVGRNPLSVIVPCHRVIGSDGALTGYAGGLPRKTALLQREGAWPYADRMAKAG